VVMSRTAALRKSCELCPPANRVHSVHHHTYMIGVWT
jgi:hypothetical protein